MKNIINVLLVVATLIFSVTTMTYAFNRSGIGGIRLHNRTNVRTVSI